MPVFKKRMISSYHYVVAFTYWVPVAILIGALCGVVGALFAMAVEHATHLRSEHPYLLYFAPVAGVAIAALYRVLKLRLSLGTDEIISTVRTQQPLPLQIAPAIFLSTTLTHLTGGSAGREGAALQLGGSIGVAIANITRPQEDGRRLFELCGMAALFSALFGTPISATVFVLEIIEVGKINDRALFPCIASALTANLVAKFMGAPVEPFFLAGGLQGCNPASLLLAGVIGIACGVVGMIFCDIMHFSTKRMRKLIPNIFLRTLLGGGAIIALTHLCGTTDYNGGGMHVIFAALEGRAAPEAFLLKILFTAVTLSMGFKGGEIVPSFFIGSTLGCTVAALLGFSPAVGAALGLVGVFCGVTNAPLASLMLSIELFGVEYLPLFGVIVGVSFMMSGHVSLYHTQRFHQPKLGHEE